MNPRLEVLDAIHERLDQLEHIQGAEQIVRDLRGLVDNLTTTSDVDFLCECVRDLEASVRYFRNESKSERELWMVRTLLRAFAVSFAELDLEPVPKEERAPDVRFPKGGAEFECKEVFGKQAPDDGYTRHTEFKAKLNQAKSMLAEAKKGGNVEVARLTVEWKQEVMSASQAAQYAMHKARDEVGHYSPDVIATTDFLVYVNLIERVAVPDVTTFDGSEAAKYGWRSVSFVSGMCAGILFAAPDAPAFIAESAGRLVYRDPRHD